MGKKKKGQPVSETQPASAETELEAPTPPSEGGDPGDENDAAGGSGGTGNPAPGNNEDIIAAIEATIREGTGEMSGLLLQHGRIQLVRLTYVGGWPASEEKTRELDRIKRDYAQLVNAQANMGNQIVKEIALTAVNTAIRLAVGGFLGVSPSLPPSPTSV